MSNKVDLKSKIRKEKQEKQTPINAFLDQMDSNIESDIKNNGEIIDSKIDNNNNIGNDLITDIKAEIKNNSEINNKNNSKIDNKNNSNNNINNNSKINIKNDSNNNSNFNNDTVIDNENNNNDIIDGNNDSDNISEGKTNIKDAISNILNSEAQEKEFVGIYLDGDVHKALKELIKRSKKKKKKGLKSAFVNDILRSVLEEQGLL